jgi:hypothetical protein
MRCPRCDADTPHGAKFCIDCGSPLQLRCPLCGADTLPRARFCAECGTPLTELAALHQILARAGAGHGKVLELVGEAGVAKSRRVYEFVHSHRTHGWRHSSSLHQPMSSWTHSSPTRPCCPTSMPW